MDDGLVTLFGQEFGMEFANFTIKNGHFFVIKQF